MSRSVDLLLPVVLYEQTGQPLPQVYLFNQGDVAYFSRHHLPYALFFLLTFTLLPMSLLFCSCFQVCLNRMGLSCLALWIPSKDTIYKNGTNSTRDFWCFSGILSLRVVVYVSLMFAYQADSYALTSIIVLCSQPSHTCQPENHSLQDTPLFFCVTSLKIAGQVSTDRIAHAQIMSDQLRAHNVALSLGTITFLGDDQRNNAACFKGSSLPESSR